MSSSAPASSPSIDLYNRLLAQRSVDTILLVNNHTNTTILPIKSHMHNNDTTAAHAYAASLQALVDRARSIVRDIDPTDDIQLLRIRTNASEIVSTTEDHFRLITVQDVNHSATLQQRK